VSYFHEFTALKILWDFCVVCLNLPKVTMKPLNLNQAAKTCKKSKAALLKAIHSGRLSAKQNELKVWEIDPYELFRVYPFEIKSYQPTSKYTDQQN